MITSTSGDITACGPSRCYSYPSTTTTLCDLPAELVFEIGQRLDNPTLLNLCLTCRYLHSLALDTFFANNNIHNPKSGCLIAYNTPVETLPALRIALFIQTLDQVNYSFNPGIERMLREVHDLHALISRMPTIGFVGLNFINLDNHFLYRQPPILNPEVWKEELQGLLNLILEKGCSQLYVQGGAKLVELYTKQVVEFPGVEVINSDRNTRRRKKPKRKRSTKMVWRKPSMEFDETQKVVHAPNMLVQLTTVSIYSSMLLRYPFYERTVAMLNCGASTIRKLSMNFMHLPQETWKRFLNSLTLPRLSDFDLTATVSFTDIRSFLRNHPSIENLHLQGVEVPEEAWPPPRASATIPILPHLTSITAHPLQLVWILDSLLLDKVASPYPINITISLEYSYGTLVVSDFALFDLTLERIAALPRTICLNLSFMATRNSDAYDWFEEHLAMTNDGPKSSVISRLDNAISLNISLFGFETGWIVKVLPDWLGMLPNVTAIGFMGLLSTQKRKNKEFVRKVAMACQAAGWLCMQGQNVCLEEVRKDTEGGQRSEVDLL